MKSIINKYIVTIKSWCSGWRKSLIKWWNSIHSINIQSASCFNLAEVHCSIPDNLCMRFFVPTEPEFLKIYRLLPKIAKNFGRLPKIAEDFWQLPKIVEDFLMTSENNWRCRKIFDDFKTGPTISKALLTSSVVVLTISWMSKKPKFLFNSF